MIGPGAKSMNLKDLFDLHEKLEVRVNAYWTYWSVVILAVGGWVFSKNANLTSAGLLAVTCGVAVFFVCNLAVLWPATKLVVGLRDEIRIKSGSDVFDSVLLTKALASEDGLRFRLLATGLLHLAVDCVVIYALFHYP